MSIFKILKRFIFPLFYHIPRRPQPKNYVHILKTMTSRSWDEIKIVEKIKIAIKMSKMKIFKKKICLFFLCQSKPKPKKSCP